MLCYNNKEMNSEKYDFCCFGPIISLSMDNKTFGRG